MNKQLLYIVIAVLAIGLSISVYFNLKPSSLLEVNSTENTQVSKNKIDDQIADASFVQKQECAKYTNVIEEKLKSNSWEALGATGTSRLEEIWFSPQKNSCLYSVIEEIYEYDSGETDYKYWIFDYLENKTIFNLTDIYDADASIKFEEKKTQLR
jgi:hypothetical protein